jgi:signal transduction histidine kinase
MDVVLAASITGVSLLLGHENPAGGWRHLDALGYALTCLISLSTVARRRAPVSVLLFYCVLWAVYIGAGYWPVVNSCGALLLLYTVAASRPPRVTAVSAALAAGVWLYAGLASPQHSISSVVAQSVVFPAVIWKVGDGARQLADRGTQLAVSAERLRHEQEELARRAVVDERVRIAREMHDVVAHHMSVVSVQAGLARYVLESDPATARAALGTVLDTSGEALEEMRRLLAVLRIEPDRPEDAGQFYDPAPGLDRLGELVARVRAAGVQVEVQVTGAYRALAPGIDLCAYRVIQESLTNVLKHAGAASAKVRLHYGTDELTAEVTDDGLAQPVTSGGSGGHGLIGMRERAKLYGGALTVGPRLDGGFQVRLSLPAPAGSTAGQAWGILGR